VVFRKYPASGFCCQGSLAAWLSRNHATQRSANISSAMECSRPHPRSDTYTHVQSTADVLTSPVSKYVTVHVYLRNISQSKLTWLILALLIGDLLRG
jgi:hypothetical protein